MDKIIWDESFSVGVDDLDKQHQELINMINQLIEKEDTSVHSEIVSETLTEMTQYMDYHFKTEEKYLADSGYPDYSLHRKQHDLFMEQTIEFCQKIMSNDTKTPAEIYSFLMSWLTNHILKSDMQYKSYFNDQRLK